MMKCTTLISRKALTGRMGRWISALVVAWVFGITGQAAGQVRVLIVGDSTVSSYPVGSPKRGWGQMIPGFFDEQVTFENRAKSGRSTKTFIAEGLWRNTLDSLQSGDYVLIQFGHNDSHNPDNPEATDADGDYQTYLQQFIDETRARGATPVLVTPMHRRNFDDDEKLLPYIIDQTGHTNNLLLYAAAMQQTAEQMKVGCIDLFSMSGELMQELGNEDCAGLLAPNDVTHWNEQGATRMASLVARGLAALDEALKAHLLPAAEKATKRVDLAVAVNAPIDDRFIIVGPSMIARLTAFPDEEEPVKTAVRLFANDVLEISGRSLVDAEKNAPYQIKVGTLGRHSGFDRECRANGIAVDQMKGRWETYVIQVVQETDGRRVLYVVGSDPNGTAYGLMELSRRIGVSPWAWWADVVPEKKTVVALPGDLMLAEGPSVRFRGIFLNDEDWGLKPWAAKTFEPETGDIGPKTYDKIFELLLRHKANAIWPAMHKCTRAFFTYPDNITMADKYGIWVGSSHCEPMLRNNVDEWHRWNPSEGERGDWNFDVNPDQITEYWRQRVEETAAHRGIYTVGMRGIHDGSMPGGKSTEDKLDILDDVLKTQRSLLEEILGEKASAIPQIFCPYKEVLKLYRAGADIPDDVTIMWADDNHGYIRQLSNEDERKRSGGAGVYYHLSYWGRPHDYLWLESTPVSLIWEEMHKAYETNARRIWIGNVGDIKPNEISMSFFLEMAWDPEQFEPEALNEYYTRFAVEQFGAGYAEEIGDIIRRYFQLGFSRKPEHMGWNTVYPYTEVQDPGFSPGEARGRIAAYDALEQQVRRIQDKLPERLQDAFFELVAYKVIGASNMNKKVLYAYLSRIEADAERIDANEYAARAKAAFERIQEATVTYNEEIAGGKWMHMMSWRPRKLKVFDMPETGDVDPLLAVDGNVEQADSSEKGDVIALEAEHYTKLDSKAKAEWKMIQGLGRMSDAMGSFPVTAPSFDPDRLHGAPSLVYEFTTEQNGEAEFYFYCLPNQPVNADYRLRFAVRVDREIPVVVDAALKHEMDEKNPEWQQNVLRAASIPSCKLRIPGRGTHTLKITMIDPGVVIDKIEIVIGGEQPDTYLGMPAVRE